MPNTLYWNSVTGDVGAAASWGGTAPADLDTMYVDGRSQKAMISGLNQTGIAPTLVEFLEAYLGDVGFPSDPLKLDGSAAGKFIWRGQGKLYFEGTTTPWGRVLIDTPNTSHRIILPNQATEIAIRRGNAHWPITHSGGPTRLFVGYAENPEFDAIVRIENSFEGIEVYQFGGQLIYLGATANAPNGRHVLAGGYLQLDGLAPYYVQTGGHCDFGVEKNSGISNPLITKAILLGGSMDATRAVLGQTITDLWISDKFELVEDSKLTVTNRYKLWE